MSHEHRLTWIALALGFLGAGLLIPFESVVTRIAGVAALFAFIGLGVFAIASDQRLSETDGDDADLD